MGAIWKIAAGISEASSKITTFPTPQQTQLTSQEAAAAAMQKVISPPTYPQWGVEEQALTLAEKTLDPLSRFFIEGGKPPTPQKGIDVTDVLAPLFPPLMLWKMGEQLPPEIAPMISPISAISTLAQIGGTPEQQKSLMERSIVAPGGVFPDLGLPKLGDIGKYAMYAALGIGGLILLNFFLRRKK